MPKILVISFQQKQKIFLLICVLCFCSFSCKKQELNIPSRPLSEVPFLWIGMNSEKADQLFSQTWSEMEVVL
jgi:hypothetical protein